MCYKLCQHKDINFLLKLLQWLSIILNQKYLAIVKKDRSACLLSSKIKITFPSRTKFRQVCLLASIKDWASLSSRVLSCNATYCVCMCYPALFASPCGCWGLSNQWQSDDTLATVIAMCNNCPLSLSWKSPVFSQHPWTANRIKSQTPRSSWQF